MLEKDKTIETLNSTAKLQETIKNELEKKLKTIEDNQTKTTAEHEKQLNELKTAHTKELSQSDQANENQELKKKTEDI